MKNKLCNVIYYKNGQKDKAIILLNNRSYCEAMVNMFEHVYNKLLSYDDYRCNDEHSAIIDADDNVLMDLTIMREHYMIDNENYEIVEAGK